MMFNPRTHRDTDFKTPDTEFSALVHSLVFFVWNITVGSSLAAGNIILSTELFATDHLMVCAGSSLPFPLFETDKICNPDCSIVYPDRWIVDPDRCIVLCGVYCFFCLEDVDFHTILHKVSTRCLILLLILKPVLEKPDTEFSHLVSSLDFFIGSVTVGSTVWQFQPIVLHREFCS